jgi:GalNAc-alpha-(1->4)-GalNAc-alpha-(1->3)-diNAcBac-PP-undecaprenol alpha-1,4-N-acetyl-D-galactosaminyltransferase
MRLTFVIYSLGSGGAERVMSVLANHFAARGDEVAIATLDGGAAAPFFELNQSVRWQPVGPKRSSGSKLGRGRDLLTRVRKLRRQIRANRPDAVVSFMDRTNFLTLAATAGLRPPVIVSERDDPAQHNASALAHLARKVLYRRARAIVVQTNAAASYFRDPLRAKTVVIPNSAPALPGDASSCQRAGANVAAMGRFSPEKGFDLLLPAFAAVADRFPDWNLTIWGDGELRPALEAQRDRLGLTDRVRMPGKTKDPAAAMRSADVFVLSSRYEGFPNVLLEAMARGTPPVSFDCPSGPAEVIEPGVNGLLVPPQDVPALAEAMAALMVDAPERRRLGANAARVTETFASERVMAMWEAIIDNRPLHSQ